MRLQEGPDRLRETPVLYRRWSHKEKAASRAFLDTNLHRVVVVLRRAAVGLVVVRRDLPRVTFAGGV